MPLLADNRSDLAGDEIARARRGKELEGINRGPAWSTSRWSTTFGRAFRLAEDGLKKKKEKEEKERREESNVSEDRARGLREDTRQASGFEVAACKTTERYPSAFRRFDPVGFCLPV